MKRLSAVMIFSAWALVSPQACADEALGRLFYTPEQRARMDAARQHAISVRIEKEENAPPFATIQLNGVITRSDGKSTLWINNRIQDEASRLASVNKGGEVGILAPDAKRPVPLKVGQSINMTGGQVEEIYRRTQTPHAPDALAGVQAEMPSLR